MLLIGGPALSSGQPRPNPVRISWDFSGVAQVDDDRSMPMDATIIQLPGQDTHPHTNQPSIRRGSPGLSSELNFPKALFLCLIAFSS